MTISLDSFEQTINEASERFQLKSKSNDNWTVTKSIVSDLGGTAVNLGSTTMAGDQISWGRSSMSEAWLERYQNKKYHLIDPFITALITGQSEIMIDSGTLKPSNSAYELNHDLKAYGYNSLYASTTGNMTNGCRYMVVFGSVYKSYAWICDRGGEASAG